ncbi:hypothetical protein OAG24_00025 [bacterium]|nr:hypothetical protein [bacterium]
MSFPQYPANQGGYRNLNNGLDKYYPGTLHTLYPGRFLGTPHFTGIDIEHEYPELAAKTLQTDAENAAKSVHTLHHINMSLGGIGKINRHPAVEPERTIEDPALSGLNIKPPVETDQYADSHSTDLSEGQIQHKLSHVDPRHSSLNKLNLDATQSEMARALETNTPAEQAKALTVPTLDHPSYIPSHTTGGNHIVDNENISGGDHLVDYNNLTIPQNSDQMTEKIYYKFDDKEPKSSEGSLSQASSLCGAQGLVFVGNSVSQTTLISIVAIFVIIIIIFLIYVIYRPGRRRMPISFYKLE